MTGLFGEGLIVTASHGAVIDHTGYHNLLSVGHGARAVDDLHDFLESRDAACELPDGSLPGALALPRAPEPVVAVPVVAPTRARPCRREWDEPKIIAAFQQWIATYGQAPRSIEWDPARAHSRGRPEMVERFLAGQYPHRRTVQKYCGSWGQGIAMAGGMPWRSDKVAA